MPLDPPAAMGGAQQGKSARVVPGGVLRQLSDNRSRYLNELVDLLKIPSVSADPGHAPDVKRAAEWTLSRVERLGFTGSLYPTQRHQIVYAERCPYEAAPTLLIYGHFDVQPPGPVQYWDSPPFIPEVRDGAIYARGASDDKGQMLTYIDAIDAAIAAEGKLPLNVKLMFEGGEEIGSPDIERFAREHRGMLKADVLALSDGTKFNKDLPAIRYGYRGLVYLQIEVAGPAFSVHSGAFGGAIRNPAVELARIICGMKSGEGKVTVPGFYDRVRDIEPWERKELASLPYDLDGLREYLGVDELSPEEGFTVPESMFFRPTLDVDGIWGGYEGKGSRTIIPSGAGAKVSMRLVPDQKAEVIGPMVTEYARSLAPPGVRVEITRYYGDDPLLVPIDTPAMGVAIQAIEYGFGRRPALLRSGGTIGAITALHRQLGINDILMMGWGNPEDGAHAPDEHFSLEDFDRGAKAVAALLYGLARKKSMVPVPATAG